MQKSVSLLLAVVLALGSLFCFGAGVAASNAQFVDVPAGAWFAETVAWAASNGITSGTDVYGAGLHHAYLLCLR